MTHASTTGEFDPEGAAPPASHAGDRRRLSVSRPVSSAPAVPTPRQQGSPVQRVTAPGPHQAPSARTSRTPRTSQTVGRLSAHLARELGRTAADLGRGLTETLGRSAAGRLRAAGALAVLAAPLGSTALAQGGSAPPPAPAGVSGFDAGPATAGPATGGPSGGAIYGGPRGFTEPEQIFRGPEVRNPLFLSTNSPFTTRGRIDTAIGDGRGYENGYTRFSAFVPYLFADNSTLFFLDAGAFASFEQGGGANLGAGVRRYFGGVNRTMGASVWFDYDNGFEEDVSFPRLGVSMESVGKYVSWRVNSYLPLDDREQVFSGITGSPQFVGRTISLTQTDVDRLAYRGIEAEAGGPLPVAGKYGATGFAGVYALQHDDAEDSLGVSGRLDFRLSDDLSVGGKITGDDVFGTNLWATFSIASPRGSWYDFARTGWLRQPSVFESLDDSVERQYRSMNLLRRTDVDEALTNADGTELLVCHVDPTAGGGGDGSIENPFASFAPILDGVNCLDGDCDIVRVIASAGDTELRTDGPVNLSDNQLLLSSAEQQLIGGAFRGAPLSVLLPGFNPTGVRPTLFNNLDTPSYVIGLADNNVVSGFTIDGSDPTGVPLHDGIISVGDKTNLPADFNTFQSHGAITSFEITRNTLLNVRDGVDIEHVGNGTGVFVSNQLTGPGFGDPTLSPQDPGFFRSGAGFDVAASGGSLQLLVQANVISGFLGEDINRNNILDPNEDFRFNDTPTEGQGVLDEGIGVRIAALDGAAVSAAVRTNAVTGNETGVVLEADGGSVLAATVEDNTIADNTGRRTGLKMLVDNGSVMTVSASDNIITNNGLPPASGDETVQPTIAVDPFPFPDNLFASLPFALPDGQLGTQVLGLVDGDPAGAGGSVLNLSLLDNTIASDTAGGDMVNVVADGQVGNTSTVNFLAQGNDLTGRQPQLGTLSLSFAAGPVIAPFPFEERLGGIILDVNNTSLQAQIGGLADGEGNTIDQAAGAGIAVLMDGVLPGMTAASIAIEGNVITDTAYDEVNIPITFDNSPLAPDDLPDIPGQVGDSLLVEGPGSDLPALFAAQNDTGQRTPYQGDGIYVRTDGFASLTDSVINRNTVIGAGGTTPVIGGGATVGPADLPGDGIQVVAGGVSNISGLTIGDPAAPAGNGNVVTGNSTGILLRRQGAATVDDVVIEDNFASGNVLDGIAIEGDGDGLEELDVRIANNQVNGNGTGIPGVVGQGAGAGVRVNASGDNVVRLDLVDNTISGNAGNGILLTSTGQQFGDTGTIVGTIARNDVSRNGQNGLASLARTGDFTINNGQNRGFATANTPGGDPFELFVVQNDFVNNNLAGVFLGGNGSATFVENLVSGNGVALPGGLGDGAGIDVEATVTGYFGLNFNRDVVRNNLGDGVELLFDDATSNFVRFQDVQVVNNGGRGYDVLNRGSALGTVSTLEIVGTALGTGNSFISGNGGEGTYVVNTSSLTQTQTGPTPQPSGLDPAAFNDPTHGLNADGAVDAFPHLIFTYENNLVLGNGGASGFDANGLVIRVGTSDGIPNPGGAFDDGGFASNVYQVDTPGVTGAAYTNAIARTRGGVVAIVRNNQFLGNAGADLLFEGFVSTVDPVASAFNATQGGITTYEQDPKSRLDLIFDGNSFFNVGTVLNGAATFGAFYDNADAAVKTRPVDQTPPGQFGTNVPATRRRNAQRLDIPPGAPGNPSPIFPLVGFGDSTFRVNQDGFNFVSQPNTAGQATLSNIQLFGPIAVPLGNGPAEGVPFIWNLQP